MLRIYLKIAWRNIAVRKFYSFLNIGGLATAVACCTLIYLYVNYNLNFDSYHPGADRIYRLVNEIHLDKVDYDKGSSYAEFQSAVHQISQVETGAYGITNQSLIVITDDNRHFKEEEDITFTDASWFNLFNYRWLAGGASGLNKPGAVVLTRSIALKYFNKEEAVGKVLDVKGNKLKVVGVIADGPYNTELKAKLYVSFTSLPALSTLFEPAELTDWGYLSSVNAGFVKLNSPAAKDAVERQLLALEKKLMWKDAYKYFTFRLLPLHETHFDVKYGGSVQKPMLLNLVIIGLLIISIAAVNYINLVVAQQSRRGVEIGTRKVLGGSAGQIFMQFMMESLLTAFIAIVVALIIVIVGLPAINNWLFTDAPVHVLSYSSLALYLFTLLLLLTVGTGAYPAWLLSRINISQILKSSYLNVSAGVGRKILVVFQNTVTQGLIVCTIIIMMQVQYLKNTDVGFDRKLVVTVPVGLTNTSQQYQFTQALKSLPGVKAFSFCLKPPSSDSHRGATIKFANRDWEKWPARFAIGDSSYSGTFGLQIIAGRNIRSAQPVPEFLINETMARMLAGNQPVDSVINQKLSAGDTKGIITGVVKDFNVNSLVKGIEPTVVLETANLQTNLAVKLTNRNYAATISQIKRIYQQLLPEQVFSYEFVDEQIAQLYKKESIQQKLIRAGAIVAIVISSLGLLGLVSLIAVQRTKEIGIRKVLGASVTQIGMLLSSDFLILICISFCIAAPLAWLIMHAWLQGFAYRVAIHWWIFGLAGLAAFVIALVSVGVQAFKAAVMNPVNSLRSE